MEIRDILKVAAELRDQVKAAGAELKEASPHLLNTTGALHTAVINLEGHLAAEKLKLNTAPADGVKKTGVTVPADGVTREVKLG